MNLGSFLNKYLLGNEIKNLIMRAKSKHYSKIMQIFQLGSERIKAANFFEN